MPKIFQNITKNWKNLSKTTNVRGLDTEYNFGESSFGSDKNMFNYDKGNSVQVLYDTVKISPECIACIMAIVEDIMSDGWRFEGSKSAIAKAEKFETESNFFMLLTDAIIDMLITGDAYLLKLGWNDEKRKSLVKTLIEKTALSKQELSEAVDKVIPKDLQMIKSGTVQIKFTKTAVIKEYVQTVKGDTKSFSPQDIVHLRKGSMGGQPYGFTTLETMLSDIATLVFAKNYAGKFFENDGVPSWLFKMPDANPEDRNYKLLKKELKEFKDGANKFRTMVLTGNVDTEQLEKWNKDMEFSNQIKHFTQLVLMGWGVPPHRVNYVMDVKSSDQQSGKIETGYYKNIAFTQKFIESILNKYLWSDFKVRMKFKKAYKIDEMREAQIIQLLSSTGVLSMEEARERIGMEPEMKGTPIVSVGDDMAINETDDKKRESGQEEQPKDNTDNKLKDLKKSIAESIEVNWGSFFKIVENTIGEGNFDRAKIMYKETDKDLVLYFKDNSWTYMTRVSKASISVEEFRAQYIPFAIRIQ